MLIKTLFARMNWPATSRSGYWGFGGAKPEITLQLVRRIRSQANAWPDFMSMTDSAQSGVKRLTLAPEQCLLQKTTHRLAISSFKQYQALNALIDFDHHYCEHFQAARLMETSCHKERMA